MTHRPGRSAMLHEGPIAGVATHGHWIATAGYDNRVILWDERTGQAVARGQHDHLVNHCAFSHDGRWLVTASSDYSARLWSVPDLRLHAVLAEHADDVDMAAFSPDDTRIATCALDRCVRIFDRRGRCLHTMRGHTGNVLSLAWTRDGRQVVSSSVDGTIRRWDGASGEQIDATDLEVRTDSVEIGADGLVYAGDDLGRIACIEPGAGTRPQFIEAHRAGVKKIALDARAERLVSLSYDRSIAIWRVGGPERLTLEARSTLPDALWARAAALLDDGRIVAGTFGGCYAAFDPAQGRWQLEGVAAGDAVNAVLHTRGQSISVGDAGVVRIDGVPVAGMGSLCNFLVACGDAVFTGGQLGRLFDARTGAVLHEHHSPLNCGVGFLRHGTPHVAIGTYTGEILVLSLEAGVRPRLVNTLEVYQNAVKGLSVDGDLLFSVCASTEIAWHDVEDWSPVRRRARAHERIANACCTIGRRRFASIGRDRTLRLWDTEGELREETHASPHANSVKCIGIDDARTTLLTGSYGGTLARFDLVRRRWHPVTRPTAAGISSIAWDAERGHFLAASYDGGIYPVAC